MAALRRIAIAQMTSINSKAENLAVCARLCAEAQAGGAAMLFLPECFAFMGASADESAKNAESLSGPLMTSYRALAHKHRLWLSLGGFHEKCPRADGRIFNTHVIASASGEMVALYRKIHLFDVAIPNGPNLRESALTERGGELVSCAEAPCGPIGLATCYDMRFPAMFSRLREAGAEVLALPSAFTVPTGLAHWEALLRARAIETQCYVVAAAQVGQHNAKRASYGHALVVDPWGKIVVDMGGAAGEPRVAICDIDRELVRDVRTRMPVWAHRVAGID